MTEQSKSKRRTATDHVPETDRLAALGAEMIEAASSAWAPPGDLMRINGGQVTRINERMLENTSEIAGRLVEFGTRRFREDMECMSEFAHCRSPEDIFSLQRKWMDTAIEDYRKVGSEFYGAGMRMMTDGMKAANVIASGMFQQKPHDKS